MTELTSGVARHWCRQERQNWQPWQDFCEDARRCYGVDKRFQRRLRKEAESRTQGRDEPVRDYIVCLRAILSKFDRQWTEERQLELLYDNMLPRLQLKVGQDEVTSVNKLIELAREAEAHLEVERNFKEPPNPKSCIMPEVAYRNPATSAKPPPPRSKSSLAIIAKSANPHNNGSGADDAAQRTSLAAIAAQSPADLSKLISKVLEEKLAQLGIKLSMPPNSPRGSGVPGSKGAYRKTRRDCPPKERKGSPPRKSDGTAPLPRLASAKNKDNQPGSKTYARFWGCSWPGYTKGDYPECSRNDRRND